MKNFMVNNNLIDEGSRVFIIAEAGVNHNGSVELAKKLISAAKDAGADAVKFQTFITEDLVTKNAPKAEYQDKFSDEPSQYEMIKKLELSMEEFIDLAAYAEKIDIIFLSSPFDKTSVDILDQIGVSAFKLGSGEITNIPLLKYVAKKGKPVILSTGMASICEIEEAINSVRPLNHDIILMYCVTSYPAKVEDVDLNVMKTLKSTFKFPVGYSDHTMGVELAVAAVAIGCCVIEKHFTLDRNQKGPDHKASLEPDELKYMINSIRNVEKGFGNGIKRLNPEEYLLKNVSRKSIVAKKDIAKGILLKEEFLAIKRPETGIKPKYLNQVIGRMVKRNILKDEPIQWDMII